MFVDLAERDGARIARPAQPARASGLRQAVRLSDADFEFLRSLAAMQVEYGQPHEGVAYLMELRRIRPSDRDVLRLLSVALLKMECWEQAALVIEDLDEIDGDANPATELYRAVVRFRLADMAGAQAACQRFVKRFATARERDTK